MYSSECKLIGLFQQPNGWRPLLGVCCTNGEHLENSHSSLTKIDTDQKESLKPVSHPSGIVNNLIWEEFLFVFILCTTLFCEQRHEARSPIK